MKSVVSRETMNCNNEQVHFFITMSAQLQKDVTLEKEWTFGKELFKFQFSKITEEVRHLSREVKS